MKKYLQAAWALCLFPAMFVRAVWVSCRNDARWWKEFRIAERVMRQERTKEA